MKLMMAVFVFLVLTGCDAPVKVQENFLADRSEIDSKSIIVTVLAIEGNYVAVKRESDKELFRAILGKECEATPFIGKNTTMRVERYRQNLSLHESWIAFLNCGNAGTEDKHPKLMGGSEQ